MGSGVAMGGRGRPGRAPQVEKREHYARLIARGFNNSEACRIVGINQKTGKRWRHGRTITARDGRKLHYAPVVTPGDGGPAGDLGPVPVGAGTGADRRSACGGGRGAG